MLGKYSCCRAHFRVFKLFRMVGDCRVGLEKACTAINPIPEILRNQEWVVRGHAFFMAATFSRRSCLRLACLGFRKGLEV